jgi:hypothetical protein
VSGPSVFGLPHLSEDAVAAYADGVLSASATARAAKHCAECRECADAVRGQRETAMMLRASAPPSLPTGLVDRLAGLPALTALQPQHRGLPFAMDPDGFPVLIAHTSSHRRGRRGQSGPGSGASSGGPLDGPVHRIGQMQNSQPESPHPATLSDAATMHARPATRRATTPLGLIAFAAAFVAAGAFGGPAQALAGASGQGAPSPAANVVGPAAAAGSARRSTHAPLRPAVPAPPVTTELTSVATQDGIGAAVSP